MSRRRLPAEAGVPLATGRDYEMRVRAGKGAAAVFLGGHGELVAAQTFEPLAGGRPVIENSQHAARVDHVVELDRLEVRARAE